MSNPETTIDPTIHDFQELIKARGRFSPPWQVIGVFGTAETINHDEGETGAEWWHSFAYTAGMGAIELWSPCASIEGRYAGHELVGWVLNTLGWALLRGTIRPGDTVRVDLGVPDGDDVATYWWLGESTMELDRYQVFQSPGAMGVIPIRWSSGLGWYDCDPTKPSAESAVPHDYEAVDEEFGSLADGGSYDVLLCRNCGRRAYSPMAD